MAEIVKECECEVSVTVNINNSRFQLCLNEGCGGYVDTHESINIDIEMEEESDTADTFKLTIL